MPRLGLMPPLKLVAGFQNARGHNPSGDTYEPLKLSIMNNSCTHSKGTIFTLKSFHIKFESWLCGWLP